MGLFSGGGFLNNALNTALAFVPGVGDYMGGQDANASNQKIASDANNFNSAQAVANREFQERMSNEAHQRETKDLIAAGLNPILGVNSGASTPSGASASATTIPMQNANAGASKLASTALDALTLKKDMAMAENTGNLQKAQTMAAKSQELLNISSAAKVNEDQKKSALEAQILAKQQPTLAKKADYESKQYDMDSKFQQYDNYSKRIGTGVGILNNAVDMIKPKMKFNFGNPESRKPNSYHKVDKKTGEILND